MTRNDKLTKLREYLCGNAKKLVPASITGDIDQAWKALEKAFGKPLQLMRYRILGSLPNNNGKGGMKAVVVWYLQLEALLRSILDLGMKSRKIGKIAFNEETLSSIFLMFPSNIGIKLNRRR